MSNGSERDFSSDGRWDSKNFQSLNSIIRVLTPEVEFSIQLSVMREASESTLSYQQLGDSYINWSIKAYLRNED